MKHGDFSGQNVTRWCRRARSRPASDAAPTAGDGQPASPRSPCAVCRAGSRRAGSSVGAACGAPSGLSQDEREDPCPSTSPAVGEPAGPPRERDAVTSPRTPRSCGLHARSILARPAGVEPAPTRLHSAGRSTTELRARGCAGMDSNHRPPRRRKRPRGALPLSYQRVRATSGWGATRRVVAVPPSCRARDPAP